MASSPKTIQSEGERKNTIPLMEVEGVLLSTDFNEQVVRAAINFMPSPGDIFLVTYPKAGSIWTQYILWSIIHKGKPLPDLHDMLRKHIPYLEISGIKVINDLSKPRIMKTHLPFKQNPYHPEAKYIYVARNIKDVCISFYHFNKQVLPSFQDGTFDEYFELYIEGKISYGDWYEHVYSWYVHKDNPNVLILTYEWMKNHHTEAVLKIADFLGSEYREELEQNPLLLKTIVENTTFEAMKKMPIKQVTNFKNISAKNEEEEICDSSSEKRVTKKNLNFFRKGQVGDWKNYLSKRQEKRLNEKLLSHSEIKSIMTLWGDFWTIDDLTNN